MKMVKYVASILLGLMIITTPMTVQADIGPKPSVVIEFKGLEQEEYYVTLLSEKNSTGPWSVGNDYYDYMGDESVFDKFCEYKDSDGYYFLSFMDECSEDDTFAWTYYPPKKFKILIYFPKCDKFYCDESFYERYAFDSYFTVEVKSAEAQALTTNTEQSYDFTWEIVSLIARVILTITLEIAIAALFFYRGNRKALRIITMANVFTQVVLNVLLNMFNYYDGHYAFVFHYIWMEFVVFLLEGVIYHKAIAPMNTETEKRHHPYLYAALANLVSLIVGIWIAKVVPGIF